MAANDQIFQQNQGSLEQAGRRSTRGWPEKANVGVEERWISGLTGAALTFVGLQQGGTRGLLLGLLGGGLVYRGASGYCPLYQSLGINSAHDQRAHAGVHHGQGVKIEKSVTVSRSRAELYQFWRKFENLPRIMNHLESVQVLDEKRSHWKAKAPAGMTVEWDAEIINEKENELIAWRSLENASVPNAGSVRFEELPGARGTIVRVTLSSEPPAGKVGSLIARLFGENPEQQVEHDLRQFKQMIEAGEAPSTAGQPTGRGAGSQP